MMDLYSKTTGETYGLDAWFAIEAEAKVICEGVRDLINRSTPFELSLALLVASGQVDQCSDYVESTKHLSADGGELKALIECLQIARRTRALAEQNVVAYRAMMGIDAEVLLATIYSYYEEKDLDVDHRLSVAEVSDTPHAGVWEWLLRTDQIEYAITRYLEIEEKAHG